MIENYNMFTSKQTNERERYDVYNNVDAAASKREDLHTSDTYLNNIKVVKKRSIYRAEEEVKKKSTFTHIASEIVEM